MKRVGVTLAIAAAAVVTPLTARAAVSVDQAHELLSDWQLEDALAAAQELLAEDPDNPSVWLLAARVQHARGEHLSALSLVDAAARAGLAEAEDFKRLVEHSASYAAHFASLETPHFSIRYLNKDEIVATYAAPILESAYANIGADLEILPAERGEKIVVEIYPDARGLAGATGLTIKEIQTSGTIAVCKFHRLMITSPLATANGYGWGDTLAHELVHLMISKKSHNNVPIWLHEGIAKYYESRWKGAAGESLGPYSENLLADAASSGKFITFQQMHPSMAKLPSQKDAALAFAQVFTVIELLRERFGPSAVAKVLEQAGAGVELEAALKKSFGMGIGDIETTWKRYVRKREFRRVPGAAPERIDLADGEGQAAKERPLESMEDRQVHDYSRLGELLQLRGHDHAAIVEYEKAYDAAGVRYVTLVNRLARAYAAVDRHDAAVALLEKALVAHPDDGDAHLMAGRLLFHKGDHAGARKHFEAVRLQNPFNPEIYAALSRLAEKEKKGDEVEQAKRFYELSRKPRPTRTYELPSPRAGSARLNIVAVPWTKVTLDGNEELAAPMLDVAVEPGEHVLVLHGPNGAKSEQRVSVAAGEARTVVLR